MVDFGEFVDECVEIFVVGLCVEFDSEVGGVVCGFYDL